MENDAKLARWYEERGLDQLGNSFMCLIACFVLAPLAIIWLPMGIWQLVAGLSKRRKGREMNRKAGRPCLERNLSFSTPWDGYGPRARRSPLMPDQRELATLNPPG